MCGTCGEGCTPGGEYVAGHNHSHGHIMARKKKRERGRDLGSSDPFQGCATGAFHKTPSIPSNAAQGSNLTYNFWETFIQAIMPNCRTPFCSCPLPSALLFFQKITTRDGCLEPEFSYPFIHPENINAVHSYWLLLSQGLVRAVS